MSNISSRRTNRRRRPAGPKPVDAEIDVREVGAGGDGVGDWRGAPVYAPGLLPGERARVRLGRNRGPGRVAEVLERLTAAPERIAPPCAHADLCGGCEVQHWADAAYVRWKDALLDRPLAARGLTPETRHPMLRFDEGRRRLRFAALRRAAGVVLGFNARGSDLIVDVTRCVAAVDALVEAPTRLRPLVEALLKPGERADFDVRAMTAGLDVLAIRERPFDLTEREFAAASLDGLGVARLAWRAADDIEPEIVAERAQPSLDLGRFAVAPPPGAFLQPTAAGEAAMAAFAAERLAGAGRIADLYSGWGPFALRLAKPAHVAAFEGDSAMVLALNRAARDAGLGGFAAGETRDLARRPLLGEELKRFDAVILDPPRSGAAAQAAALAAEGPARVVYLSCNPAALARDARTLVDGGYRFVEATPIDQFRWTPHLEVAAFFLRESP